MLCLLVSSEHLVFSFVVPLSKNFVLTLVSLSRQTSCIADYNLIIFHDDASLNSERLNLTRG